MVNLIKHLEEAREVFGAAAGELAQLREVADYCVEILAKGGTIFACGNGGSSAQTLHFVEELTGRYKNNRRPLRAIALGGDAPAITCIANDFGYDEVFSRPLQALGRSGDIVFAFSTSGNSPSIVKTLEVAKQKSIRSVLVTGENGGKSAAIAEHILRVPSLNNARVQEVHTFYLHSILEVIEASNVAQTTGS